MGHFTRDADAERKRAEVTDEELTAIEARWRAPEPQDVRRLMRGEAWAVLALIAEVRRLRVDNDAYRRDLTRRLHAVGAVVPGLTDQPTNSA